MIKINITKECLTSYIYYTIFRGIHLTYGLLLLLVILFVKNINHLIIVEILLSINILTYYLIDGCPLTVIENYYLSKADDKHKSNNKKIGKVKDKKKLIEKKAGIKRLIFSYATIAIKIMFIIIFTKTA